jgi:hypothetical protein
MYGSGASAPKDYRRWLAAKITPIIRRHGLERRTGSSVANGPSAAGEVRPGVAGQMHSSPMGEVRSSALGRAGARSDGTFGATSLIEAALPPDVQPTLF